MGHSISSRRKSKSVEKTPVSDTSLSSTQERQHQWLKAAPVVQTMATNGSDSTHTGPDAGHTRTSQPLSGKVYAITGGASGIGLATAKLVSERGGIPCIADIDTKTIEETRAYFAGKGVPFMITKVDVSQRDQVDSWIGAIVKEYGRLDGACNSAGVIGKSHGVTPVRDLDDGEWHKIIGVNLTGTMYCLRAQLRNIVDKGSIVNITSIHGVKGFPLHASYDASKHGIVALTKAAALENGDREIRVNAVAPGSVYTALMQKEWDFRGITKDDPFKEPTAFRRHGTVEETANVICFLLGPESTFVSGSVYQVDGAWQ